MEEAKKKIFLIGYQLAHSFSPLIQKAAIDFHRLNIDYQVLNITPSRLEETINDLRQSNFLGANVTMPYKEMAIFMIDELDELAAQIGAINVVVNRNGNLVGHNTDASAFLKALQEDGNFDPQDKRVVILGAGGLAKAVGFVLIKTDIKSLSIFNRSHERATALKNFLQKIPGNCRISASSWNELQLSKELPFCDLLVNCTSVGMKHGATEGKSPLNDKLFSAINMNALIYDSIYNPLQTPLLIQAKSAGMRNLGGLNMLIYQGAEAFKLWTGKEAPIEVMLSAVES